MQISTGLGSHSCALRSDGRVTCWGDNQAGQLNVPQTGSFVQIGAGAFFSCALRSDGEAICWGSDGTIPGGGVSTPAAGPFQRITVGGYHACGQRVDGSVECWGRNTDRQLDVSRELRGIAPPPRAPLKLPHSCGHWVTGIAFDGLFYYVAEGHNDGTQCITRYTSVGVKLEHKRFSGDIRGLHYVPATRKLFSRTYNGPLLEYDYDAGTGRKLAEYTPTGDPQNQPAGDPDGATYWMFNSNAGNAELHRLTDNALLRAFAVTGGIRNSAAIAVSANHVYMQGGTQVYRYDKSGAERGTSALTYSTYGCNNEGYGFGAAADDSRIMYAMSCETAVVEALEPVPNQDTEVPVIFAPRSVIVEATDPSATPATFDAPTASDNVGVAELFCDRNSGDTFPLGTTTVTCTAVDFAGNSASAVFQVVVVDTTAPTVTVPADYSVDATDASGAVVFYAATSTEVSPVCSPATGSLFPIGSTTVTCTATDVSGNTTTKSFVLTVKSASAQVEDFQDQVAGLDLQEGTETSVQAKLSQTLDALAAGNTTAACGTLGALINQVNAQVGKKITAAQAADIVATAERIRSVSGCT